MHAGENNISNDSVRSLRWLIALRALCCACMTQELGTVHAHIVSRGATQPAKRNTRRAFCICGEVFWTVRSRLYRSLAEPRKEKHESRAKKTSERLRRLSHDSGHDFAISNNFDCNHFISAQVSNFANYDPSFVSVSRHESSRTQRRLEFEKSRQLERQLEERQLEERQLEERQLEGRQLEERQLEERQLEDERVEGVRGMERLWR